MYKLLLNNKINLLFLFISFLCLVGIVGVENISFKSTKWLHNLETSIAQTGWYFFKNDIWRFPLGSNPNYGISLGNSIIFSDSIPILALLFKSLRSFISGNFQYFSFWYFICFYLQLLFSFKILKKFTNSIPYSLVGSLFFLIAPIFIYRINFHATLSGQWILLFTLYLGLFYKADKEKLLWFLLLILSSLIHFYFMAVIAVIYSLLRIFNLKFEKENFYTLLKDFLTITPILLLTLYIVGYFEIRMADSLGVGFAYYKLNILSIFDPINSHSSISWSWFLPDIKLSAGEEIEGFNYFGLGQIMMVLFALILLINKNYKTNLVSIKSNKEIKIFLIISLFLTFWALSNKISLGTYTLEIPIHKYLFAALSIIQSSGRIFWIVNYLLLILSIIIIFKCFDKKKSLLIITLFLIIQVADVSAGLKKNLRPFTPFNSTDDSKDQIWEALAKKYKILKTTYLISWSKFYGSFAYFIEKNYIEKTNIVSLARMNRKAAAEARYHLYNNFRNKNLASDTIYLVDNLGHLRHLKYIFKNENVGFFYRDNVWAMVMNEKGLMNDNDKKIFSEISPKLLKINERKDLYFEDEDNFYGFGWSHNSNRLGIWSEGPMSTLFFKTDKKYGDLKLEILYDAYITKKNDTLEFGIYINNSFDKNMKLTNNNQNKKFEIIIKKELINEDEIKIDFNFTNPVSPFEVFESPDSRKLGILIKKIKIESI